MADGHAEVETIYREQAERLWRSLLAFGGDPDLASEAMSEAFAQALARGAALRSPAGWIWSSAFAIARGMLNDRAAVTEAPLLTPANDMPSSVQDLVRALRALSPNQRLAIVLHDYADRPTKEVASVLGASAATVHVHLSVGRRRLRAILEANDAEVD